MMGEYITTHMNLSVYLFHEGFSLKSTKQVSQSRCAFVFDDSEGKIKQVANAFFDGVPVKDARKLLEAGRHIRDAMLEARRS